MMHLAHVFNADSFYLYFYCAMVGSRTCQDLQRGPCRPQSFASFSTRLKNGFKFSSGKTNTVIILVYVAFRPRTIQCLDFTKSYKVKLSS